MTNFKKIKRKSRLIKLKKKSSGHTPKFGIKLSLEKVNWDKVDAIFAKEREAALQRLKLKKAGQPI